MGHRAQLLPAACHKRPQTHGENSGFLDLMILGCRGAAGLSWPQLWHQWGLLGTWSPWWSQAPVGSQTAQVSSRLCCAGRCFSGQSTTKESPGLP